MNVGKRGNRDEGGNALGGAVVCPGKEIYNMFEMIDFECCPG